MKLAHLYMPQDRQYALWYARNLADVGEHSILFCDIAGFTPLTEVVVRLLGPARGAELLTSYLNLIYDGLIQQVDAYGGSVIGFAGDAMTCLFPSSRAFQAAACSLAMQEIMGQSGNLVLPNHRPIALAMKVIVVTGSVRRFLVGDPSIQLMDVLAGKILDSLAIIEQVAEAGEVLLDATTIEYLGQRATVADGECNLSAT